MEEIADLFQQQADTTTNNEATRATPRMENYQLFSTYSNYRDNYTLPGTDFSIPSRPQSVFDVNNGVTASTYQDVSGESLDLATLPGPAPAGAIGGPAPLRTYLKMIIPHYVAGTVIGRDGLVIVELQNRTNTRIWLSPHNSHFPGTNERICLIMSSSVEEVLNAMDDIQNKIAEKVQQQMEEWNNSQPGRVSVRDKQLRMILTDNVIGRVVGTGGMNIIKMSLETGAQVKVLPATHGLNNLEYCVQITGETGVQRRNACGMILHKLVNEQSTGCNPDVFGFVQGTLASDNPWTGIATPAPILPPGLGQCRRAGAAPLGSGTPYSMQAPGHVVAGLMPSHQPAQITTAAQPSIFTNVPRGARRPVLGRFYNGGNHSTIEEPEVTVQERINMKNMLRYLGSGSIQSLERETGASITITGQVGVKDQGTMILSGTFHAVELTYQKLLEQNVLIPIPKTSN